ncbi:MAG: SdpI family protein [Candidatus Micrarchaeota archaeon]
MRNSKIAMLVICVMFFAMALYFYPQFPEKVASHWNAGGEVDGYMPKFWGVFLFPLISVFLAILFILIPLIDPLKSNIEKFRHYYDRFIIIVMLFFLYIYILTILWNTGTRFDMSALLAPAIGILIYYCGVLMENAKRNWFIGIRTPWTLSNDKVWNKTHKLGARLYKIAGVVAFLGVFLQSFASYLMVLPIVLASIYCVVYSYFEYQKQVKK